MLDLARTLPIPSPWDRDVFVQGVADMRGRPITLIPTDTASLIDSPCGLWLRRDSDDLILHEAGTSDYHVDQIVCHEIGHMLLGHGVAVRPTTDGQHRAEVCRGLLPTLDPESVLAVLGRKEFEVDQERDAEMFAYILMLTAMERSNEASMMRSVFFRSR
ncbi:hypothetical protein BKG60_18915 [Mycobacterium syngnathidarum]|nr:hypothetical protein BKG60_18915 [Mycobacterium syngnathidarum]